MEPVAIELTEFYFYNIGGSGGILQQQPISNMPRGHRSVDDNLLAVAFGPCGPVRQGTGEFEGAKIDYVIQSTLLKW